MSFIRKLHYAWGLFMGISVPYLKSQQRELFPLKFLDLGQGVWLAEGGSCNCGVLFWSSQSGEQILLINTGVAQQAKVIHNWLKREPGWIFLQNENADTKAGVSEFQSSAVCKNPIDLEGIALATYAIDRGVGTEWTIEVPLAETIFLGSLFYNKVHPFLSEQMNVEIWSRELQKIIDTTRAKTFVPAEGAVGSKSDVLDFIKYLQDLSDEKIEFSMCRASYNWKEIQGRSSLEENYELLRRRKL